MSNFFFLSFYYHPVLGRCSILFFSSCRPFFVVMVRDELGRKEFQDEAKGIKLEGYNCRQFCCLLFVCVQKSNASTRVT